MARRSFSKNLGNIPNLIDEAGYPKRSIFSSFTWDQYTYATFHPKMREAR